MGEFYFICKEKDMGGCGSVPTNTTSQKATPTIVSGA